jgi:uncharacterized protein (TIGR02117 family)
MLLRPMLLLLLALLSATASADTGERRIFVTSNGWHSGIVVARGDVPLAIIPESVDFPDAAYLEFGWGDAVYYPTPRPGLGLALGAVLPGPAVLHLAGLPDHPGRVFPTARVVELSLSPDALTRLLAHLAASIDRGGATRAESHAAGLYPFSRFYPATGRFHLFNTCNTWTARALQAAGLAIDASGVQTVDDLMARLAPLAATP